MSLNEELKRIFGQDIQTVEALKNEVYLTLSQSQLPNAIAAMAQNCFELVSLFCVENFSEPGFTLFYVFEKAGYEQILVLKTELSGNQTVSIAKTHPSACWYEREVTDGFGIQFEGSFDKRRLFLHESYPADFHPLLKTFQNSKTQIAAPNSNPPYEFKRVEGEAVYEIPVGPVHAGIIEPGHFRFSVIGETIFNLEVRMFYKHRGLEKLAEEKTPQECVKIAETISGDETVANAVAFCIAAEKISGIQPPKRALHLRTLLLELERVYSHLGDLAGMCVDVAYPVGASPFFILREEIFRQNEALTGSRFMKGIIALGGLTKDMPEGALKNLSSYLLLFLERFNKAIVIDSTYFSVIDRFETTGKVKPELLAPLHITGPVARASGKMTDTRITHPYGLYGELIRKGRTLPNGDVLARFNLKAAEVQESIRIIQQIIAQLETGEVSVPFHAKDGYSAALVEAPRGQNFHWLQIRNGIIHRYKVRTASFCNWQAIEHAVLGNIVPDFPLINKSMNLSYAGMDM